jgi:hypothetical protein
MHAGCHHLVPFVTPNGSSTVRAGPSRRAVDAPIMPRDAQELGLRVSVEMPAEVIELMTLHPQPTRTRHNVEYLPSKRERQMPPGPPAA